MIRKFAPLFLALLLLTGCSTFYILEGQRYESKEAFNQASDNLANEALASVVPLPTPLSKRKLIFAIPSESTMTTESLARATRLNNGVLNAAQVEMMRTLSSSNYRMVKVFYDAVLKRSIYASTQLVEMSTMAISLEASPDADVLYMTEPAQNAGQWFFGSNKQGRQVFAYDRSAQGAPAKVKAFLEAVQAQAVRE